MLILAYKICLVRHTFPCMLVLTHRNEATSLGVVVYNNLKSQPHNKIVGSKIATGIFLISLGLLLSVTCHFLLVHLWSGSVFKLWGGSLGE